ncbi:MAG TPA: hypothetical protein VM121_04230 [Acidimicrobiales bacterium]|nr:hypothetical protein [Acidimicrobiales bacterium]
MEIDAIVADSAITAEGKLYLQGGAWYLVSAPALPIRIPRIGLGISIRVAWTDTNQPHNFDVRLQDADGHILALGDAPPGSGPEDGKIRRIGSDFNVGRPAYLQPGDDQLIPLAMNIDGLVFEAPGRYEFVISIDGEDVKRLPMRIVETGPAGPTVG